VVAVTVVTLISILGEVCDETVALQKENTNSRSRRRFMFFDASRSEIQAICADSSLAGAWNKAKDEREDGEAEERRDVKQQDLKYWSYGSKQARKVIT
jgi:hypothetical protein